MIPPSLGAFMDVFIEVSIEVHLAAWQFIMNRPQPQEGAGGRLKPAGSRSLFVVLVGFLFFFGGGVTQLCIVFHSPASSSKVRLC